MNYGKRKKTSTKTVTKKDGSSRTVTKNSSNAKYGGKKTKTVTKTNSAGERTKVKHKVGSKRRTYKL